MRWILPLTLLVACAPTSKESAVASMPAAPSSAPAPRATASDEARADVPANINERWLTVDGKDAAASLERDGREVYEARDAILAALRLQPGQAVADVGAGSGLFTRLFSDAVGATGTVYAVDIAEKLLAHIAAQARQTGRTNIRTVLGSAQTTGLAAGSVDLVFVSDTYHHFEYPQAMLRSIRAALRPEGQLVVIDFERIEGQTEAWIMKHVRAGREVVIGEIEAAGFRRARTVDLPQLEENYFVVFQKSGPS